MKTILITGMNGFLGSSLATKLQETYNVVGLIRDFGSEQSRLKGSSFKLYSSKEDLEPIFLENEIHAVIHTATVYRRTNDPIENLIEANVLLPVKLYSLANKYKVDLFLNTDSFFNNPEFDYKYLVDYTLSKKQVLEWLKIMQVNCHLINMKIFHMYGKNDGPDKFIPRLLSDIKSNQPTVQLTPGEQRRDFIYIEDVVNAYSIVLQNGGKLPSGYTEFQIGTGESASVKELAVTMADVTRSISNLDFGALPYRENEIMNSVANNENLIALGWKQKFTLREGLTELIS